MRGHSGKILGAMILAALCARGWAKDITDGAGRMVTVPDVVTRCYATSQIGIIVLYTLNPDKLAGWGFALGDADGRFIPEKYHALPVLGVWSGKNGSGNIEEIMRVKPDVIFSIGTIEASQVSLADRIQKQTGIPVVVVDAPLAKLDAMYEFVGGITGDVDRGAELSSYCRSTVSRIGEIVAKIPENERKSVYYAEGAKGLETDPKGSFHTEVLDFVGGVNAAKVQALSGYGRTPVSLESLYGWNPDLIIVGKDKEGQSNSSATILANPDWKPLKAVTARAVYDIPNLPFDWFDRPPSVNRIMGVVWLAQLLYPEYVRLDLVQETRQFYKLFYSRELSEAELTSLIGTR